MIIQIWLLFPQPKMTILPYTVNPLSTHHFLFTVCHPNANFSLLSWYSNSWQLNALFFHQIETTSAGSNLIWREKVALKTGGRQTELLTEIRTIYPQIFIISWKSQRYFPVHSKNDLLCQQAKQWGRNTDACLQHSASFLHTVIHYHVNLHGKTVILISVWQYIC